MPKDVDTKTLRRSSTEYSNLVSQVAYLQIASHLLDKRKKSIDEWKKDYDESQNSLENFDESIRNNPEVSNLQKRIIDNNKRMYDLAKKSYQEIKQETIKMANMILRNTQSYRTTAPTDLVEGLKVELDGIGKLCNDIITTA